jgi:hypothetical protein
MFDYIAANFGEYFSYTDMAKAANFVGEKILRIEDYDWRFHRGYYSSGIKTWSAWPGREDGRMIIKEHGLYKIS